jgi:hypothetical protein
MKKERNLSITFDNNLPIRAAELSPELLSKVFGGECRGFHYACRENLYPGCCPGLLCRYTTGDGYSSTGQWCIAV